jgi:hypothetical protein
MDNAEPPPPNPVSAGSRSTIRRDPGQQHAGGGAQNLPAIAEGQIATRQQPDGFDDIDLDGAARAKASDAVAQNAGLVFDGPTLFAWGTKGQWGDAAARARAELNAQPLLKDIATKAPSSSKRRAA